MNHLSVLEAHNGLVKSHILIADRVDAVGHRRLIAYASEPTDEYQYTLQFQVTSNGKNFWFNDLPSAVAAYNLE